MDYICAECQTAFSVDYEPLAPEAINSDTIQSIEDDIHPYECPVCHEDVDIDVIDKRFTDSEDFAIMMDNPKEQK